MIKKYQILSEDARCNLLFAMENVSGPDNIACDGYHILIQKLAYQNVLNMTLKQNSTWDHLIQISAAAHYHNIPLNLYIDPEQATLSVYKLYAVYIAILMKAKFSLTPIANSVSEVPEDLIQQSLADLASQKVALMKQQLDEIQLVPKYIVYPYETSIFAYADFYPHLCKAIKETFSGQLLVKTTLLNIRETVPDFTSWIQTMDDEANLHCFYGYLNKDFKGVLDTQTIFQVLQYVPRTLLNEQYEISNMDDLYDKYFAELLEYYQKPEQTPAFVIDISRVTVKYHFKTFLNTTHTLACDSYIAPFAAVMDFKFRFASNDVVLCYITGSILTTKRNHDYISFVSDYLYESLLENCELIDIRIYFQANQMSTTTAIQQLFKTHNVTIHHWKFHTNYVSVKCYTPGYQSLVNLSIAVDHLLGEKSFDCPDMPKNPITSQKPITVDYSGSIAEHPCTYTSNIKGPDDITCKSIEKAYHALQSINAVDKTRVLRDNYYSKWVNSNVYRVMENIQQTGSFKIRGASSMLLKANEKLQHEGKSIEGVIACSAGNHAQGVAKTANLLDIKCTIVCPESAPETKLYNTMRYNAEVIKYGPIFDVANEFAQKLAIERGWLFIPPYNHYDVMEGQGTIAYELLQNVEDIDTILVNVGGGGMISGISLYAKKFNPKIKIIGVQASRVFPMKNYKETGQLATVDKGAVTIADGCNVKFPGGIHNDILYNYVDQYISVEENEIAATIINMLLMTKTVTEGAGCMGLTALLYKKYKAAPTEKVAVIICGGNIDISRLQSIFKMGSVSMGKRLRARIPLPDAPGKFLEVAKVIQQYGGIIDQVNQIDYIDRVDWDMAWLSIEAKMACLKTTNALKTKLKQMYPKAQFPIENLIPE